MKILLFVVMLAISVTAYSNPAQRYKPVVCVNLKDLVDNLTNNYEEKLDFVLVNQTYADVITNIAMYRNKRTGSWTMIEYSEDPVFQGEGCILGSGKEIHS